MATVTSCGNLCTLQLFKLNQSAFLTDGEKKTFFKGRQLTLRFDDLWRLTVITPLRGDAPYTKSILCTIVSFFYVKFIWYCVRARNHCCVLWDVTRDCAPAPLRSLRIRTRVHSRGRRGRGKGEKKVCSLSPTLPFSLSPFPPGKTYDSQDTLSFLILQTPIYTTSKVKRRITKKHVFSCHFIQWSSLPLYSSVY